MGLYSEGKGEQTRQRILSAGLELFYRKGAHRVSFQEIGNKVGITQAAIYSYYRDKDDLLVACAAHAAESGRASIDKLIRERDPAEKRLKEYIRGNIKWVSDRPEEANAILAVYYFAAGSRRLALLHRQIDQAGIERIETLVISGIREGSWRVRDTGLAARAIHNFLVGEMLKAFNRPKELSLEKRTSLSWSTVLKLLS